MDHLYRFGPFELDPRERTLRESGDEVSLQDLPTRLLIALVERAPATVDREELAELLWPPGTHLDLDASLNTAVARVREALGDDAGRPEYVATVPRRGYRFVAAVRSGSRPVRSRSRNATLLLGIAAVGLLTTLLAIRLSVRPTGPGDPGRAAHGTEVDRQLAIGRHQADRRDREGLEKAIAAFQSAVALEPDRAGGYAGLASTYALLGMYDYWRPREAFEPAELMAGRALELDPDSAEAQLALALVEGVAHWNWESSERAIERAIELAPDSPEAHYWRGALLSIQGHHEEGIAATRQALELDPTSPVAAAGLSWRLFLARRHDEAIEQARRTLELHPDYFDAWDNLKWILIHEGDEAAALDAWVRAEEIERDDGAGVLDAARKGGLDGVHRAAIESQTARWSTGRYQSPFDIALELAALEDVEGALVWLQRSFGERESDLPGIAVDPRLDPLRGDPRFTELVERLGLPGPSDPIRPAPPLEASRNR